MSSTITKEQLDYLNDVLADTLKSFWDERGRGARYRTTLVGVERFASSTGGKKLPGDIIGAMQYVKRYLVDRGIVGNMDYVQSEDFTEVFEVTVEGCLHLAMEHKLKNKGLEPMACPCANLIMYVIEQSMGFTTELASVEVDVNSCKLFIVVFKPKN